MRLNGLFSSWPEGLLPIRLTQTHIIIRWAVMLLSVVVQFFVCQIGQNKLLAVPAAAKLGSSFIPKNVAVNDFPIQVDRALPRFCLLDHILGEGN